MVDMGTGVRRVVSGDSGLYMVIASGFLHGSVCQRFDFGAGGFFLDPVGNRGGRVAFVGIGGGGGGVARFRALVLAAACFTAAAAADLV